MKHAFDKNILPFSIIAKVISSIITIIVAAYRIGQLTRNKLQASARARFYI